VVKSKTKKTRKATAQRSERHKSQSLKLKPNPNSYRAPHPPNHPPHKNPPQPKKKSRNDLPWVGRLKESNSERKDNEETHTRNEQLGVNKREREQGKAVGTTGERRYEENRPRKTRLKDAWPKDVTDREGREIKKI